MKQLLLIVFGAVISVHAMSWQPAPYAGLSAGISWQQFPDANTAEENDTVTTEALYAAGGIEWLPGISTGLTAYLWGDRNVNQSSEVLQFDGISAGWDVTLRLPLEILGLNQGSGPYWRSGRHCWAASATGALDPWAEKGCSDIDAWGINFPLPDQTDLVIFVEYSETDFRDIESRSVLAGVQARF